ncbi:MAG: hypothetical protein U0Z74_01810 [Romboutsia timonensis]
MSIPDLFELDNKDILHMSPQFLELRGNKYWNLHSSSYMIGNLDYKNNKYNLEKLKKLIMDLIFMHDKH